MTDVEQLKATLDLRMLVEALLGKPKSCGNRGWNWKCPFHDEHKGTSLAVWSNGWRCFGACQTGGDAIAWVMKYHQLDFREAVRHLGGDWETLPTKVAPPPQKAINIAPAEPPPIEWQTAGWQVLEAAEATLWSPVGEPALTYLRQTRGLIDMTIRDARLGYLPGHYNAWQTIQGLTVPCGILIPWIAEGALWGLKVRRAAGDRRYVQVAGGNSAGGLYGVDNVWQGMPILLVEGEFNCLTAWQEGMTILCPISLGSASGSLNQRWMTRLLVAPAIFALFDDDKAGHVGEARAAAISRRIHRIHLPEGFKDLNEFRVVARDMKQSHVVFGWLKSAVTNPVGSPPTAFQS